MSKKNTKSGAGNSSASNGKNSNRKKQMKKNTRNLNPKMGRNRPGLSEALIQKLKVSQFYDPRASANAVIDLYASNMNTVIPFRVPVTGTAFVAPVLAAVSYALQRGWTLSSNLTSDPYYAAVYMISLVTACAKNEIPQGMSVPVWLHYICQSVTERKVKMRGGQVDYSFEVLSDWTPTSEIRMGVDSGQIYNLGVKGTVPVNTVFRNTVVPAPYTEDEGARAAQSMWLYLAAVHPNSPMHKTISISSTNALSRDASPYAVISPSPGGGYEGTGGWNKKLESEVPIWYPLFSVYKQADLGGSTDASRASNYLRNFTGDGFMLGGMLTYKLMPHQLKLKNPPNLHFVDFNEFLDVLAQAMTLGIARRLDDADTRENISNDGAYIADNLTCPLTILEVSLILRYTIMAAFDDSQLIGQATYPRTRVRNANEFTPFLCGANTCPQSGATMMRIPLLMKQNILALRERVLNASRAGSGNPQVWIPILGQYLDDVLPSSDYNNVYEGEIDIPTFNTVPGEVNISLIDGAYPGGAGAEYAWINDPGALVPLMELWNEWTVKMANYFWTFDTIGSDMGIDPLFSGCMTRHWTENIRTEKLTKKKVQDVRFEKMKIQSKVYSGRKALAVSSYVAPFKNAWEGAQQFFVLPTNKIAPLCPGVSTTFTSYPRIAAFREEEFQIPLGSDESNFVDLAELHTLFANQMVKTKFATVDMTQKTIEELDLKGDAGILSSLAAALAGKVIPGIGPIAKEIANFIPI